MKITVLGKYGPFPRANGATSGYLLKGEKTNAVIDMGSGTLSRLLNAISIKDLNFVILSHLHFDHISDIFPLSYALNFQKNKKVNLYLPNCDLPVLEVIKGLNAFNIIFVEEGKVYNEGEFTFSFYEVKHPVKAYGVKITNGTRTLAYTGDSVYVENLKNLVDGANLIIADGAFLKEVHNDKLPHMSIAQAVSLERFSKGAKVMVSHINYAYTDEEVIKEIKMHSKSAFIAKENTEYNV
ncbi:MAG: MBL fold metallo-hydrolase [Clostridia bacterium]|nr:MBL fold metallo-hydrolase [Clostridia bacterium]